ncbi:MAG: hypothetical protein CL675_01765 [Bdellovibrionaceae bacterium]|nr:hypothetical protein [Pseudobdellovibrionaceae bacterium]
MFSKLGFALILLSVTSEAADKLTPQVVASRLLQGSRQIQIIDQESKLNELSLRQALGVLDLNIELNGNYQITQAENSRGLANEQDTTKVYSIDVTKTFRSGTESTLGFERTNLRSILSSFFQSSSVPDDQTIDIFTFELEQPLWNNSFGASDRAAIRAGKYEYQKGKIEKLEGLETLVMDGLEKFWTAYVAQQTLKESIEARERYRRLERTVRQKSQRGVTTPGELERVQAELETQEQNVKLRSATFLDELDVLYQMFQLPVPEEVVFAVDELLPALPPRPEIDPSSLRTVKVTELEKNQMQEQYTKAKSDSLAEVNLVASAVSTGLEEEASAAFSEMTSFTRPTYYVGLRVSVALDSDLAEGTVANAGYQRKLAELRNLENVDQVRNSLRSLEREVRARYFVAESAIKRVQLRERALRRIDEAYRQGRFDISEVTDAYNNLFESQTDRLRAIGNYHIARNRLAALRDELIKEN